VSGEAATQIVWRTLLTNVTLRAPAAGAVGAAVAKGVAVSSTIAPVSAIASRDSFEGLD
jgi:hypothetical protein